MNLSTITERLYQKSDLELRKKIETSIAWIWDEKPTNFKFDAEQEKQFATAMSGKPPYSQMKDTPWLGYAQAFFTEVAFHYLRDRYREKALTDFMTKVNSIDEIIQNQ